METTKCKRCNGKGTVNKFDRTRLTYRDYPCGQCTQPTEKIRQHIDHLFPDRTAEDVQPWIS